MANVAIPIGGSGGGPHGKAKGTLHRWSPGGWVGRDRKVLHARPIGACRNCRAVLFAVNIDGLVFPIVAFQTESKQVSLRIMGGNPKSEPNGF